jgi:predicted O-methyltransferase YrrM
VSADFKEFNFERYVKSIDTFENETFDMVVVDGRARPSCIKRAIPKIKSQGLLVLDNSDRKYYLIKTGKLLNGWQSRTFRGTVRGLLHLEQTTVFRKP